MTIDWDSEEFRKLYVRTSTDFAKLPFSVRCLATELLRHCDRAGRVILGTVLNDDLVDRIAFQVRAHDGEHRFLRDGLERLLSDSADPKQCYLVFRGGYLTVRNLSRAHGSRSGIRGSRKRPAGDLLPFTLVSEDPFTQVSEEDQTRETRQGAQGTQTSQGTQTHQGSQTATVPLALPSGSLSPSDLGSESGSTDPIEASGSGLTKSARVSAKSAEKSPFQSDDERAVFEYWSGKLWPMVHKTGHPRATGTRLSRIRARLKDGFSVSELVRVVDVVSESAWHLGENPSGKAYIEPETIFQSEAKVATWLTTGTKPAARSSADQRVNTAMARVDRLRREEKERSGQK